MRRRKRKSMFRRFLILFVLAAPVLCFLSSLSLAADRQGAGKTPRPTEKDKCPVCGMFIVKYPDWTAAVLFRDGGRAFFDGPKDMFKYVLDLKRYAPSRKFKDISGMWVMDYYAISPIDATKAWYVVGSDVFGPMGNELIPLGTEADAREFMKDHRGKKLLLFSDITLNIVKTLD